MKRRKNRVIELAGINACKALFESNHCVFQGIEAVNDFGKDAYVDFPDGDQVSGNCIALQIKTGKKYRRSAGYSIPIHKHRCVWQESPMPVAGIVLDDTIGSLYWVDISSFITSPVGQTAKSIPIPREQLLTAETLAAAFIPHFRMVIKRRITGQSALALCSDDVSEQSRAIWDCFALGRSDPRPFILLRRVLGTMKDAPLRLATHLLAHVTPHPDIFWTKNNWVPEPVCQAVVQHLRWTTDEVVRFFSTVRWEEWQRGGLGQSLFMLLLQDPDIASKLESVAIRESAIGNGDAAWAAFYLSIYFAKSNAREKYDELVAREPRLGTLEMAGELRAILSEFTYVSLF